MENAFSVWFALHFDVDDFRFYADYQECENLTADAWDAAIDAVISTLDEKEYKSKSEILNAINSLKHIG
jgi:hypothetical protein